MWALEVYVLRPMRRPPASESQYGARRPEKAVTKYYKAGEKL
jgi:hypothetical protein